MRDIWIFLRPISASFLPSLVVIGVCDSFLFWAGCSGYWIRTTRLVASRFPLGLAVASGHSYAIWYINLLSFFVEVLVVNGRLLKTT